MSISIAVAIGLGGALGALSRYALTAMTQHWSGSNWPWGTLFVNTLGSLLIGILTVWFLHKNPESAHWRMFWITGALGSLTTYSTFSMQTVELLMNGSFISAGGNIAANLVGCLMACALGVYVARQIWPVAG